VASPRIGDPSPRIRERRYGPLGPAALFAVSALVLFVGLAPASAGPRSASADPCLLKPTSCLPPLLAQLSIDPPDLPLDLPLDPPLPEVPIDPPDLPVDPPDLPVDPPDLPVDPPELPVDPPVEPPAEEVTDLLPDPADDVIGAVPGVPGNDGSTGEATDGGSTGGGSSDGGGSPETGGGAIVRDPSGEPSATEATAVADVTGSEPSTRVPVRSVATAPARPSTPISQRILDLTEQLRFPLILFAAVFMFLLVQNLLDRRDPKLILAPSDTETLAFE